MKTIKIKYVDFWEHWNQENNFITNCLRKKYNIVFSNDPDYIIFSHFDKRCRHMNYDDCVKIFYTQENICPDFNFCDYGISFEKMDYGDRHLRFPIFFIEERYGNDWRKMLEKHKILSKDEKLFLNREFCSFVVSNGNGSSMRTQMFESLCQYKQVHSGGRYMNNIDMPKGVPDKFKFAKAHKFSLCFENSSHPGYVTEKIIEGFAAQTIPIYWGSPDVTEIFNSEAFIDVSKFENIDDAVEYIKKIDQDDEKYLSMLKTPALNPGYEDIWNRKQKELETFFDTIFEQTKENSYRRNRVFWGERYSKLYKTMRNLYVLFCQNVVIRAPREFVHFVRNQKRK